MAPRDRSGAKCYEDDVALAREHLDTFVRDCADQTHCCVLAAPW